MAILLISGISGVAHAPFPSAAAAAAADADDDISFGALPSFSLALCFHSAVLYVQRATLAENLVPDNAYEGFFTCTGLSKIVHFSEAAVRISGHALRGRGCVLCGAWPRR